MARVEGLERSTSTSGYSRWELMEDFRVAEIIFQENLVCFGNFVTSDLRSDLNRFLVFTQCWLWSGVVADSSKRLSLVTAYAIMVSPMQEQTQLDLVTTGEEVGAVEVVAGLVTLKWRCISEQCFKYESCA